MAGQSVSLEVIAQRVGVSRATVARALRNKDRVSEDTRKRVLRAAQELGYRPNLVARSLAERRSATLGVLIIGLESFFTGCVVDGIEEEAQAHEHAVLLVHSKGQAARERELSELLLAKGVDGIIVMPAHPRENAAYFNQLAAEGIPLLFVDRFIHGADVDFVVTDNFQGGYLAARHLIGLGRKHVAHLANAWGPDVPTSLVGRWEGYMAAMAEAGLTPLPMLTLRENAEEAQGARKLGEYLDEGAPLEGICAAVDGDAAQALAVLSKRDLRVPRDVSVVGFNDSEIATLTTPALTSVRQPMREMGKEAVRLLFGRLGSEHRTLPPRRLLLQPNIVVRESCGALGDT